MTKNSVKARQKRLRQIEDRKIEILMEIGETNKKFSKKILKLQTEYKKLNKEYYYLQLALIKQKSKIQFTGHYTTSPS